MRAPLVARDRKYPFDEDVIVDETGAVDANLGITAKLSSLIEVLCLGGSYEVVSQLWAQFTLSAVQVNLDMTWSRDEILVGIATCSVSSTYYLVCTYFFACSVQFSQWDVRSDLVSWHQLRGFTWELLHRIRGTRRGSAGLFANMEEERLSHGACGNIGPS